MLNYLNILGRLFSILDHCASTANANVTHRPAVTSVFAAGQFWLGEDVLGTTSAEPALCNGYDGGVLRSTCTETNIHCRAGVRPRAPWPYGGKGVDKWPLSDHVHVGIERLAPNSGVVTADSWDQSFDFFRLAGGWTIGAYIVDKSI